MPKATESPGARLRILWQRLSPLPGGAWLFSRLLGVMVPYSGTIGATVQHFSPGQVTVRLRDRRKVRNHLNSVHAIALANLGELCTGLSLVGALGSDVRGILVGIETRYTKKARGMLDAEARCEVPVVTDPIDYTVHAEIRDAAGDVVAVTTAHWRLGPVKEARQS